MRLPQGTTLNTVQQDASRLGVTVVTTRARPDGRRPYPTSASNELAASGECILTDATTVRSGDLDTACTVADLFGGEPAAVVIEYGQHLRGVATAVATYGEGRKPTDRPLLVLTATGGRRSEGGRLIEWAADSANGHLLELEGDEGRAGPADRNVNAVQAARPGTPLPEHAADALRNMAHVGSDRETDAIVTAMIRSDLLALLAATPLSVNGRPVGWGGTGRDAVRAAHRAWMALHDLWARGERAGRRAGRGPTALRTLDRDVLTGRLAATADGTAFDPARTCLLRHIARCDADPGQRRPERVQHTLLTATARTRAER